MIGLVVRVVLGSLHVSALTSLVALVWAVLQAQSLHPAALSRALPDLQTKQARQALRRVRRALGRPHLGSEALSPKLLGAVLRLIEAPEVLLVLDSTRCGRWEVFTLGVRVPDEGRVVPIAWSVLAYPWPKGQFTPTVCALLERTFASWPKERALHLVADRGFPSLALFQLLGRWTQRLPLGYTLRLRAGDYVWVSEPSAATHPPPASGRDGSPPWCARLVRSWLLALTPDRWTYQPAAYRQGKLAGPASWLVVGRGTPQFPPHQQGPADQRRRAERAKAREAYLRRKRQPGALLTDRCWAVLTTAPSAEAAVAAYTGRFSTEHTYRDWHAWGFEDLVAREADPTHVDTLAGLAALAYLVQVALGFLAGRTTELVARARQHQWSTTDRLSVCWRGRQVLHDPGADWQPWLVAALTHLAQRLAPAATPRTARAPLDQPTRKAA